MQQQLLFFIYSILFLLFNNTTSFKTSVAQNKTFNLPDNSLV
jgi:hypothetical protein